MHETLNGTFHVPRGDFRPKHLPPKSTAFDDIRRWRDAGVFLRVNHHFVMADREHVGRDAPSSAAVLDTQSVKTTESGGPRGYDTGEKSLPPRRRR